MTSQKKFAVIVFLLLIMTCSTDTDFKDDADWSFALIGDVRSGYGTYEKQLRIINRIDPHPAFLIVTGDLISTPGNDQEWHAFRETSKFLSDSIGLYTAVGNHDVDSAATEKIYRSQVSMPGNECYYSFEHRGFYFIILDTEVPGESQGILNNQYSWLVSELNSAQARPDISTIAVSMHRPLFQETGNPAGLTNADDLQALFETYDKLKLVLPSHVHAFYYLRKNGILHIVSGGGGAPLHHDKKGDYFHFVKIGIYETENRINIKVIGTYGEIIENFDY